MAVLLCLPLLLGVALLVYWRARASRRRYHCSACGETLTAELMTARRCNCCGAALEDVGPG